MMFTPKYAGRWIASKDGKVVASSRKLDTLVAKVKSRKDGADIRYDLVPRHPYFAG